MRISAVFQNSVTINDYDSISLSSTTLFEVDETQVHLETNSCGSDSSEISAGSDLSSITAGNSLLQHDKNCSTSSNATDTVHTGGSTLVSYDVNHTKQSVPKAPLDIATAANLSPVQPIMNYPVTRLRGKKDPLIHNGLRNTSG